MFLQDFFFCGRFFQSFFFQVMVFFFSKGGFFQEFLFSKECLFFVTGFFRVFSVKVFLSSVFSKEGFFQGFFERFLCQEKFNFKKREDFKKRAFLTKVFG